MKTFSWIFDTNIQTIFTNKEAAQFLPNNPGTVQIGTSKSAKSFKYTPILQAVFLKILKNFKARNVREIFLYHMEYGRKI